MAFWTGLTGFLGGMLLLSFLRADVSPIWRGMRIESWVAIALLALSAAGMLVTVLRGDKKP